MGSLPVGDGRGVGDYAAYKGDICKYLDGDYRMNTWSEFGVDPSAWDGLGEMLGALTAANYTFGTTGDGQTLLPSPYGATKKVNDMWFPASGHRHTAGTLSYVSCAAFYWSGSASGLLLSV